MMKLTALALSAACASAQRATIGIMPVRHPVDPLQPVRPTASDSAIPRDCTSWNDGCNTCMVRGGRTAGCTEMMCFRQGTPFCAAYTDGRQCTDATTCMIADTGMVDPGFGMPVRHPVDPLPPQMSAAVGAGGRCAANFCEDQSNCPQCASGLECVARAGMMCAGTCFGTCRGNTLPAGAACTTQRSRGQAAPTPCQDGLTCTITDRGMIAADRPNSGVCQAAGSTASSGACARALSGTRIMPGAMVVQCDDAGNYMPVQCNGSVGSCWCVDSAGAEVAGSRKSSRNGDMVTPDECQAHTHGAAVAVAATAASNPSCWSGAYDAARCCAGKEGDASCWSGRYTFAFCCNGNGH